MRRFQVGDYARVKYIRFNPTTGDAWREGAIVEIIFRYDPGTVDTFGDLMDYIVQCSDGTFAYPIDEQLEPAVGKGSWDEIERITKGWNPLKETVEL